MSDREIILRRIYQTLFRPVLEQYGRDAPPLEDVEVSHYAERDELVVVAYFGAGQTPRRVGRSCAFATREISRAWGTSRGFVEDVRRMAQNAYSREYEDHLMRMEERALNEVTRRAMATAPPDSNQVRQVLRMRDEFARHVRTHHHGSPASFDFVTPLRDGTRVIPEPEAEIRLETYQFRQEYQCDWDVGPGELVNRPNMTTTEMRARQEEANRRFQATHQRAYQAALMRYMRTIGMNPADLGYTEAELAEMGEALGAGIGGGNYAEAQKRGLELLKANLTLAQREQYATVRHFDVRGGRTGKIYRIHHGRQMNIAQYPKNGGKPITGLCFLPRGNLVDGDVMLAQKMTLEAAEDQALRIANRFRIDMLSPLHQVIEPPPKPIKERVKEFFRCDPIDTI